jgi:hypothetical protein
MLLRTGGRTAYFTIFVTPGLSKRWHRRAVRLGPRAVGAPRGQADLLAQAGFADIEATDVTEEFLGTARRWHKHAVEFATDLRGILGDELSSSSNPTERP